MKPTPSSQLLATQLRQHITGEVRFDEASRALYATDASNYRQIPIGVVIPRTIEEVVTTIAIAHEHAIPILPRGAGTSLAGQTCNIALIIDTSKYLNRVIKIQPEQQLAWVEPGIILDEVHAAVAPYQLTFGPDPATHDRCTLGGMIGNNSCGTHSVFTGKTVENIEALEIMTYDGLRLWVGKTSEAELTEIIQAGGRRGDIYQQLKNLRDTYAPLIRQKFPKIPRRVSGYNLEELLPEQGFNVARALVGTEGTCVTILQAVLRLVPLPQQRVLVVLGFADIYKAGDCTPLILPYQPHCLEGLDADMINDMRRKNKQLRNIVLLPKGGAWLLIEFGGATVSEATAQAQQLISALTPYLVDYKLFIDIKQQKQIWSIRESGASATNSVPGEAETYPGWEDAAVDPQRIGDYLRDFRQLLKRYGYKASLYGHFGDGCIHARITFDLRTQTGIQQWRDYLVEATDLVIKYGGSLSGEHGDGQARAELLPRLFGAELMQAFQEFKNVWDAEHKMNPGKIIQPYRVDENLRFGTNYQPIQPSTHFSFANDQHSFANAVARCVGVGKCRRTTGGLMCPSYKVTRDEQHSTRGRAHLLFELLQSDSLCGDWDNKMLKEALELCLACKGCKSDCPVTVDMATYKAEFFAHYYQHHRRPLRIKLASTIHQWARLAAHIPKVVNFFTQTPLLRETVKWVNGIAPQRQIPVFAVQSFREWFAKNRLLNSTKLTHFDKHVILWVDTFNNYFRPQTAIAALEVLENYGYQVHIPHISLCCGRPLYDSGQLDQAQNLLQEILDNLRQEIASGAFIVGLEPSCISVFRDELLNFFPNSQLAQQLSQQTYLFSEFLIKQVNPQFPTLKRQAIVHGHCHHKAIFGLEEEIACLQRLGLEFTLPESGCCGMAGAFGFNRQTYPLSVKLGEMALLPEIRQSSPETLIIANGFSCREQITQLTGRPTLHLAEVIRLGLQDSD